MWNDSKFSTSHINLIYLFKKYKFTESEIKYKIVRNHLVKELIQKKEVKELIHRRTNIILESFQMAFHMCPFKKESIISLIYAISNYSKLSGDVPGHNLVYIFRL